MDDLVQLSSEVEVNQKDMLILDRVWIDRIKKIASKNYSGKYRTCIHKSEKDNVHEMLIVHTSGAYVRPHKHRNNGESLQFIEGVGTAIIFNEDGEVWATFDSVLRPPEIHAEDTTSVPQWALSLAWIGVSITVILTIVGSIVLRRDRLT